MSWDREGHKRDYLTRGQQIKPHTGRFPTGISSNFQLPIAFTKYKYAKLFWRSQE